MGELTRYRVADMAALMEKLNKNSIGMDTYFDRLTSQHETTSNYPPYNIVQKDNTTFIEIALAGYSKENLSIVVEDGVLSIEAKGLPDSGDGRTHIHKGIATRKFKRDFKLGEYVKVESADFDNGLLTVTLQEIIPEEKKPKVIDIN